MDKDEARMLARAGAVADQLRIRHGDPKPTVSALYDAAEMITALLDIAEREAAARKRVEWQPIETAPKDVVMLVIENAGDEPVSAYGTVRGSWEDNVRGNLLPFEPRFWLPMPSSLSTSTEQEKG